MKTLFIASFIAAQVLVLSCGVPARPAIRIGVSPTPGAGVLYLAQAENLFSRYEVYVELVELSCAHELEEAFVNGKLDAAVLPYSAYEEAARMPQLEAGVLLLISAPRDSVYNAGRRDLAQENGQQACEIDVLAGKRGDVMQRRADWQKLLMAYEHARLMLCSGLERHMMKVAECEYKSLDILRSELQEWTIFGCMQQDSLIGERGPYSHVDASWQGQVRLSDLVASQSQHLLTGRVGAVRSSEAR